MCPHEEKLTAWLLGDLPHAERDEMTRHLNGCAACRAARDELGSVLAPLRSGLAKDRAASVAPSSVHCGSAGPRPAATSRPRESLAAWLWRRPHDGLRRAALFIVSFGTLFAVISMLYQSSQREPTPASDITHIEFRKASDEAPAPELAPMAAPAADAVKRDDDLTYGRPLEAECKPVSSPSIPAAAPTLPKLKQMLRTDSAQPDAPSASAGRPDPRAAAPAAARRASPSAPPPRAAATAAAKRERAKWPEPDPEERPSAGVRAKPLALVGATPASPAKAAPTNATPTNAVAPATVRSKP